MKARLLDLLDAAFERVMDFLAWLNRRTDDRFTAWLYQEVGDVWHFFCGHLGDRP